MKTAEFNENYEIDRKSKGVKAMPKNAATVPVEILTADGKPFDSAETYHFFDEQTQQIRLTAGLRRDGEHLCTFGLKVVAISKLRANKDNALADGQLFFKSEIERLQAKIAKIELEKSNDTRSLKAFLMAKE